MRQEQAIAMRISTETSPIYANTARTPPISRPSNLLLYPSITTAPSTAIDNLYCTIDTSRVGEKEAEQTNPGVVREAIEKEIRSTTEGSTWRCVAVTKDMKNLTRIRVACRNEEKLLKVKMVAEKLLATGTRVLRDQLYQVKINNANRAEVL